MYMYIPLLVSLWLSLCRPCPSHSSPHLHTQHKACLHESDRPGGGWHTGSAFCTTPLLPLCEHSCQGKTQPLGCVCILYHNWVQIISRAVVTSSLGLVPNPQQRLLKAQLQTTPLNLILAAE